MNTESCFPDRDPEAFYELTRDRLASQLTLLTALEQKIGLVVGLASALLGILAGGYALRGSLGAVGVLFLLAVTGLYVVAAYKSFRAYYAREWEVGPKLTEAWTTMWSDQDDRRVAWGLAADYWHAYYNNCVNYEKKTEALKTVFILVVTQTLLVALALALVAAGVA